MRYMMLIYDNEAAGYPVISEAERDAVDQSYGDFTAELAQAYLLRYTGWLHEARDTYDRA
jgi:hypothetical protein